MFFCLIFNVIYLFKIENIRVICLGSWGEYVLKSYLVSIEEVCLNKYVFFYIIFDGIFCGLFKRYLFSSCYG